MSTTRPSFAIRRSGLALVAILLIHTGLLASAGLNSEHSARAAARVKAGRDFWRTGLVDDTLAEPPLVPALASVPFLLSTDADSGAGTSNSWRMSRDDSSTASRFDSPAGWRSTVLANCGCLPFSLLGAWACAGWARALHGPVAGLVSLLLWCCSPLILSTPIVENPEIASAGLAITAGFFIGRWLRAPDWATALFAGFAVGAAMLAGFAWSVLLAVLPLLWLIARYSRRSTAEGSNSRQRAQRPTWVQLGLSMCAALYVINLAYLFDGSFTPLGAFRFTSDVLRGPDHEFTADANRFRRANLGSMPVPLPARYVNGFDAWLGVAASTRESRQGSFVEHSGTLMRSVLQQLPLTLGMLIVAALLLPSRDESSRRGLDAALLIIPPLMAATLAGCLFGAARPMQWLVPLLPFVFVGVSHISGSPSRPPGLQLGIAVILLLYCVQGLWAWWAHAGVAA